MSVSDAITHARAALAVLLTDSAQIKRSTSSSDNRGGQTPGTPTTVATVACNIQAGLSAEERELAERLGVAVAYTLRVPVGTDITSADQIVVGGRTFEVIAPLETTIALTMRVLCKEVT